MVVKALTWVLFLLFRDARVVKDMATGKSKGYGFVSFFNKWVSCSMGSSVPKKQAVIFSSHYGEGALLVPILLHS